MERVLKRSGYKERHNAMCASVVVRMYHMLHMRSTTMSVRMVRNTLNLTMFVSIRLSHLIVRA